MSNKIDDRSEVLMNIITRLVFTLSLGHRNSKGVWVDGRGDPEAQFVGSYLVKPKPGDLVMCDTGSVGPWKFAYFVEDCVDYYMLREIGSDKLCRISNESLSTLVGISQNMLLDGLRKKIYRWATHEAFWTRYNKKADHYHSRCGGVEFIEDNVIRIWIRAHIFSDEKKTEDGTMLYAQPWYTDIPFDRKTRLKDLVEALLAAGFGKKWEYLPKKPTEGTGGVTTFTNESLTQALNDMGVAVSS